MKPSKIEDRHKIYKLMLKRAINDPCVNYGFCFLLYTLFLDGITVDSDINSYPELMRFRPKGYRGFWFPRTTKGWEKRIEILIKCIEMTRPKKKLGNKKKI